MSRLQDVMKGAPTNLPTLPAWLNRLASTGIVSNDPVTTQRQRFTNMFAFASGANVLTHIAIFCVYDFQGLMPLIFANTGFLLVFLAVPFLHRFGAGLGAHIVAGFSIAAILFTLVMLGRGSQIYVYFTLSGIILFMFGVENPRSYLPWFVAALLAISVLIPQSADGLLANDPALLQIVSTNAVANVIAVNALIIYFVLSTLRRTERALQTQYDRVSTVISSVLPAPIVDRLTAEPERRIADRIDGLSVLFADLAGFTQAARGLPPEAVIDYLDDMVRVFDDLCEAAGAEKIKTIGDSYMAVGGLDGDEHAGASAVGLLALSMLDAQARQPTLGAKQLSVRIGIHTGSAIAGIIGDRRFSYDVWGDAVNIASRMESHGQPGRIHVSHAYRSAAADRFHFEKRGAVDLRSVGTVETWFLTAPAPTTATA